MSWSGYFAYNGQEFINVERTEMYARNDNARWFKPTFKNNDLHEILAHAKYRSPLQDDTCPWTDPDDPATYGFYGIYPLDVAGLESSTRTSAVVENTTDGGNAGRLRHGTKQIVFNVLLLAEDDAGANAGMAWLRNTLMTPDCFGGVLTYLSAEVPWNDGSDPACADGYFRQLLHVVVNNGPTVTEKRAASDGSAVWWVTFTATAGIPFEFGLPEGIMLGFLDPLVADPATAGGAYDDDGYIFTEVACPAPIYTPVFDPLCPDLILPPTIPQVLLGCFVPPVNWRRFLFDIPPEYVRQWTDQVPVITIYVDDNAVRNLRVRMYVKPIDPDDDPCLFSSDFLISYVPPFSTMVIDGRDETVMVYTNGQARRADGLVYDSNRHPFTWPQLTGGAGYTVVLDAMQTQVMPSLDFDIVQKAR